jgi:hypothetical protein
MPIVLSLVCPRCGARARSDGAAAWITCSFCHAIAGIDARAYQDELQRGITAAMANGTDAYIASGNAWMRALDQAYVAADAGDLPRAIALAEEGQRGQIALMPVRYPPRAKEDADYAAACVRRDGWLTIAMRLDHDLRRISDAISKTSAGLALNDPLPTFEKMVALLAEQGRVLERIEMDPGHRLAPAPPDPDGLAAPARFRIHAQTWAATYARMMDEAVLVKALALVYGADAVTTTTEGDDEHGMFFDWPCPRCGLVSITARSERRWTCLGCMRVFPFRRDLLEARAAVLPCAACGALVTFGRAEHETRCRHCSAIARRVADDGALQRELANMIAPVPDLPPEGEGGFPVTSETAEGLVLDGLERIANFYAKFVSPARYARIVASTFSSASPELGLRAIDEVAKRVASSPDAVTLVAGARALLVPTSRG